MSNNVTLYADNELSESYGTCSCGETNEKWKSHFYYYSHKEIDDEDYYAAWGFGTPIYYNNPAPSFVNTMPQQTNASTLKVFYITSNLRMWYQWMPSRFTTFAIKQVDIRNASGTWIDLALGGGGRSLVDIPINDPDMYFEGVGFLYGAHKWTMDSVTYKGYGYWLILRNRDISGGTTVTNGGLFISENCLNQMIGKRKRTRNDRKGGGASGTIPRGTIAPMPVNYINNLLMNLVQGNGYGLTWYRLFGDALSQITRFMYPRLAVSGALTSARRNAFVSLIAIPYDVPSYATNLNTVYLADKTINMEGGAQANLVGALIVDITMGKFTLRGQLQNDFTDVAYTEYTLYLPGYGTVPIDASACAQGEVIVDAALDVRNGNVTYMVSTISDSDDGYTLLGHYSANIGVKIPVSGTSSMGDALGLVTNLGKTASATVQSVGAFGSGNVAAGMRSATSAFDSLASTAEQGVQAPHVSNGHLLDSNISGLCSPGVRMIVTQNRVLYTRGYRDLIGQTSAGESAYDDEEALEAQKLSDYTGSGFFSARISKIDIPFLNDDEKEELRELLKGGVWL